MKNLREIGLATVLLCAWLGFASTALALADAPETTAPAATDAQTPRIDDSVERMLKDMAAVSTWGHPDLYGEFGGMQAYAKGDYATAMTDFKFGALYADKLSQLTLGLMYDGGLGVARDSATGCAWLMLAAERKVPRFVVTRDKICDALTPEQRATANSVFAELAPKYADAVAKLRIKHAFDMALRNRTGSRTGYDMNASTHNIGYRSQCDGNTVIFIAGVYLPRDGCVDNQFWAPDNWNADTYFANRDAQWYRGEVSVSPVEPVPPPKHAGDDKPADGSQ
ncbi:MAG TPA: sel1 repeat family protein [Rudaea sp.]|nr:sel1 repeat family protein [Rudaea sp.]